MASTIISRISDRFDAARDSEDLLFFPSTIHHLRDEQAGVEVMNPFLARIAAIDH